MTLELSIASGQMQNAAQIKIRLDPNVCTAFMKWLMIVAVALAGVA